MTYLIVILSFFGPLIFAHEGGETTAQIGPGKAVESVDADKGIKLSTKATKMLGIKTVVASVAAKIKIPKKAAIHIKESVAVYILRGGLFKFIEVKVLGHTAEQLTIVASDIKNGDQVVVDGAPLLRVAHLNVMTSDSDEHAGEHVDDHARENNEEKHND